MPATVDTIKYTAQSAFAEIEHKQGPIVAFRATTIKNAADGPNTFEKNSLGKNSVKLTEYRFNY